MIQKIQVKQEHIDKAIALAAKPADEKEWIELWSAKICPVYQALADVFGKENVNRCMSSYICFDNKEDVVYLPANAKDKIIAYDAGLGMEPFEFEIDV